MYVSVAGKNGKEGMKWRRTNEKTTTAGVKEGRVSGEFEAVSQSVEDGKKMRR